MKHFKDLEGNVFAFEEDGSQDHLITEEMVSISDEEVAELTKRVPSEQQIKAQQKMEGVEFEGVMCSATSEDMWGLASIKEWIRAGQTTNFEFKNGNVLTLSNDNIDAFEAVWVPFRASFF